MTNGEYTTLVYDEALSIALPVCRRYGLRTLDSLQLATFLTYCEKEQDSFVCADRKLAEVVEQEGVQAVFV